MRETWKAVVFDLDGTLVDSAPDLHAVLGDVMADLGLPAPPLPDLRAMIGDGARVLIQRALAAAGHAHDADTVEPLFHDFLARYTAEPCRFTTLFPGCREMLDRLAADGARLGLCTNKPQAPTAGLLRALGLERTFGSVIGGDALQVRKPDAGHFTAVLDDLGVAASDAVMIGDSRNDLLTARAAGVPCVLVSFGYTAEPASTLGADRVIDRLDELPGVLADLRRRS